MQFEDYIFTYLTAINAAAFFMFWLDKRRSKAGAWRIPELNLLCLAMIGGSLGALLAQQIFRHKTTKQPFRGWLIAIALCHLTLAIFLFMPPLRHLTVSTLSDISNHILLSIRTLQNSR